MMNKLVDSHFHLDYYPNYLEMYDKINLLKQYTICVTSSPGVFISCQNIFKRSNSKFVRFALGFHPQNSELKMKDFLVFKSQIKNTKYIGEVGLDFTSSKYLSKADQLFYFEEIVKACYFSKKIMTIHVRKSEYETINILSKYIPGKYIIHWFNGNEKYLKSLISLGCYFSINTNMLNSIDMRRKLLLIPKDRILIESDGPFTKVENEKYNPLLLNKSYELFSEFFNDINFDIKVFANFKNLLD